MSVEDRKKASCNCSGNDDHPDVTGETSCGCMQDKPDTGRKGGLNVVKAPRIYRDRRPVRGEVVTIIDVSFKSSGIDLVESWSRAVPRGDIHEIMIWNPAEGGDDAAAVAFIEITQGGNIINGDEVRVDGEPIGNLAGFDYNHMPNHMNVVVETKSLELPLKLGSVFEFTPNPMLPILDEDCC
ncbi:MAG: hypothetical protein NTV61_05525 [Candidatus Bathyarchaeota archaeon]|nr:hypothetical protein [Candidatus Bathyarchaeota archaeon]